MPVSDSRDQSAVAHEPANHTPGIERQGVRITSPDTPVEVQVATGAPTAAGGASAIDFAAFACVPAVLLLFFVWGVVAVGPERMRDFRVFWEAGERYLAGAGIYPSLATAANPPAHLAGNLFVYPAGMAALFSPLSLLPYPVACGLWLASGTLAVLVAIRLLGVRDWRCYGAAFLWPATLTSLSVGTLTPFLVLGLAALWRWRDQVVRAGLVGAFVISSKLFLWPLLIWLAARRLRAAVLTVVVAVLLSLLAWWPLGYRALARYPSLLHAISRSEGPSGYQVLWFLLPHSAVGVLLEVFAIVAAAVLFWWARRSEDADGFRLAVAVALLLSPILWLHYFALLVPVAALRSPRLSWVWLLPVALWATPFQQSGGVTWRMALGLGVIVAMSMPVSRIALWRGSEGARLSVAAD